MNHMDDRIFQMAEAESMAVPAGLEKRIERLLEEKAKKSFHFTFRKVAVLVPVCALLMSVTVSAAVSLYQQRMEAMNHEELEQYFEQLCLSGVSSDHFNRPLSDGERARMEELKKAYLEQGSFPQKELFILNKADDYKNGVGFLPVTSTFFFPKREMEDEELLQLIDFMEKREYSLKKINDEIEKGELVYTTPETEDPITESVTEELCLSYEGTMGIQCVAAGKDAVYLGGYNRIECMDIGSGKPQLFFDGFEEGEVLVSCLYQAEDGSICAGISDVTDAKSAVFGRIKLYRIGEDGKLLGSFTVGEREQNLITGIAEDAEGNLYIHVRMRETDKKAAILIYDKTGKLLSTVQESDYVVHEASGLGRGKDGRVYVAVQDGKTGKNGLAQIEAAEGSLCEISSELQPEGDNLPWDIVRAGVETDFIMWGYEGIFTYNAGDKTATQVLEEYEIPCSAEGACVTVLSDGRVLFINSTERTEVTLRNGKQSFIKSPEKTSIYYVSTVKK